MKNKAPLGILLAFGLLAMAVVLRYFFAPNTSIVQDNNNNVPPASDDPDISALLHNHSEYRHIDQYTKPVDPAAGTITSNPHLEAMTPEMKQALRDKLLLHGTMETFKQPDGNVILPSRGRSTQMPVAVEMPDGSIVIKEYSEVPN